MISRLNRNKTAVFVLILLRCLSIFKDDVLFSLEIIYLNVGIYEKVERVYI